MNLKNVTIVCIDCKNHVSALRALNKSIEKIQFAEILFISDREVKSELPNFRFEKIEPIKSKEEYSYFMISRLGNYIKTDFCLVVQFDGYIINPDLWVDDFLNYDYIGAPWWYTDGCNVGNGGFSLRSKKLLNALQLLMDKNDPACHPEDNFICRHNRKLLEKEFGIKYAPEIIARQFSFEPNGKRGSFKNDSFGFHGLAKFIL